jgi:integrase
MGRQSDVKLTQRFVSSILPGELRRDIWDSDLSGFGLRVEKSGSMSFVIRYRANGGGRTAPRRFMTIGRYGTLTVEEARRQAKIILGSAAKGDDPAGILAARRREMTVAALIEVYGEEGSQHLKDRTRRYVLARLSHHVIPLLGHKRLTDVRVQDVERFIQAVSDGKTASDRKVGHRRRIVVRGGPGAAAKVVRDLSAVFSFAVRREIVSANPCAPARKPPNGQRHRFLETEEIQRFGTALSELEAEGANAKGIAVCRLLALTGCRRDEIAGLKWDEVDTIRGRLVLDESKTGRSIRPLSASALKLLATLPKQEKSPFVFPADTGDGHYQGLKGLWPKLMKRAKLEDVTPHTLRHTVGSLAASAGEGLPMVGALLGHSNHRSSSIYAHLQEDPSRRAADRIGAKVANALSSHILEPSSAEAEAT